MTTLEETLGFDGPTAIPRANGEMVFSAPWESRAFGMAAALADAGLFSWSDFQRALICSIAEWEAGTNERYSYYERWLTALESLVVNGDAVDREAVDQRAAEFLCRPAGWDHDHDHDHVHDHQKGAHDQPLPERS